MALTQLGLYGGPRMGTSLPTGYTGAVLQLGAAALSVPGAAAATISVPGAPAPTLSTAS